MTGTAHSVELGELAAALAAAQAAIEGAETDGTGKVGREGAQRSYKYATLASVWDACRKPLTENGLSVVQCAQPPEEPGTLVLTTMLLHRSGQYIAGTEVIRLSQDTAQGYGSAMTYGRRYGLAAMVGVCPDDDDDGAAASRPTDRPAQQPAPQNVRPATQATQAYASQQEAAAAAAAPASAGDAWDVKVAEATKEQGKWFLAKVEDSWHTIQGSAGVAQRLGEENWRTVYASHTFEELYRALKKKIEDEDAAIFSGEATNA